MTNPLGVRLTSYSMMEDAPVGHLLQEALQEGVKFAEYAPAKAKLKKSDLHDVPQLKRGEKNTYFGMSPKADQRFSDAAKKAWKALSPAEIAWLKKHNLGGYRALKSGALGVVAFTQYMGWIAANRKGNAKEWHQSEKAWGGIGGLLRSIPKKLGEAAPSFNRHQMLMSPGTRELVLKSRMTEIEAFANDRGLDPHVVGMICEVAMRTGRVPDMRQYGIPADEAKALGHFISGDILNLAIEDIERMERELVEGKKKLHPEMHKHTDTDKFKAHVGDPKDTKKPFHKGKGLEAGVTFDKEQGFVSESRSSPEVMQKFYDLMDQNSAVLARLQTEPGKLTKRLIMLAKQAGMTPMQALGPAVIHAAKYVKQGKIKRRQVAKEDTNSKESTMLGPDPVAESTTAGGVSNPLGMGSAFIERPRALFSINQWEKTKEENKAINADPWIGVDMEHQSGYTLDQILKMEPEQTAVVEGANPRPTLATRLEEGTGLEGKGKKGTALAKALKTSKKKITSPAEDPPGDFDTASGGTSSGDTDTHGRLKEMTFSKEHGFVIEGKKPELTKKQKAPKNKAKWAKMSPEQKKNWGAATKSKPFHSAHA